MRAQGGKREGLSQEEAKRFYDSIGKKQDIQFYENRALSLLMSFSNFGSARKVFEFGCGTGRLAVELLTRHLGENCSYLGVDISETMIGLCVERLSRWKARAEARLVGGPIRFDVPDGSYDRFVAAYVLDLLSESDAGKVMAEAYRIMEPDGLLCVVSLARGDTPFCRAVSAAWLKLFTYKPYWVGGCRPIEIGKSLDRELWGVVHDEVISAFGGSSEVLVARALKDGSRIETENATTIVQPEQPFS